MTLRADWERIDAVWGSIDATALDKLCADVCAELEINVQDVPSWDFLSRFYLEV